MTDDSRSAPARLGYELGADDDVDAQEFEEVAAQLGLATRPITPPASLKADLFAKLASTPQLPAGDAAAETHGVAQAAVAPGPAATKARRRWSVRPVAVLVAAAAAIAIFVGGAFIGSALSGGTTQQQQQASALAAINAAPDAKRASAHVAGGGTATLVWSGGLGTAALVATDLPALPNGKTYELWYLRDHRAVPAGTMNPAGSGSTWRVLSGRMKAGDAVGVTVEPEGGSEKPSSAPIVAIAS